MLLLEKTRQHARLFPLQRALVVRGLHLLSPPEPVRYRSVEEVTDDGPLYLLGMLSQPETPAWNEWPEADEVPTIDLEGLRSVRAEGEQPLYENHGSSAQQAWLNLADKQILEQVTHEESDGRQFHVERGRAGGFHYLYCANTYDQRQLVLIEPARAVLLDTYYRDITSDMDNGPKGRVR